VTEENQNAAEPNERTILSNRFITAWVNFCTSVVTLQSNEKSFQAWFASPLIQEFGLARVYREVHLDKPHIKGCFSGPELKDLFPKLYRSLGMDGNELFPDVCVSRRPYLDTRHTAARSRDTQHFTQIIKEIDIVTELKVAMSEKGAMGTQYNLVYLDVQKLGLIMNATGSEGSRPLFFACVLENLPKPKPVDFVERKFTQRLQEDGRTWPANWRKPTILITAPISVGSEAQWCCYLIDGASDWKRWRVMAQFSSQFAVQPESPASSEVELPRASLDKPARASMSEQQLIAKSSVRCRGLYSGLRDLAQSEEFGGSDFTGSGYTFRFVDKRTHGSLLLLRPDYLKMFFGSGYPPGFLNEKTDADFWSRVAAIPAFKAKMSKKNPEVRLDDESWSHEDVATFLSALRLLENQS